IDVLTLGDDLSFLVVFHRRAILTAATIEFLAVQAPVLVEPLPFALGQAVLVFAHLFRLPAAVIEGPFSLALAVLVLSLGPLLACGEILDPMPFHGAHLVHATFAHEPVADVDLGTDLLAAGIELPEQALPTAALGVTTQRGHFPVRVITAPDVHGE